MTRNRPHHPDRVSSRPFLLLLALCALLFTGAADAAILDVCASGCTYDSVEDAVDAAAAGDIVELDPETFDEGGIEIDKNLTIRSSSGRATIDAASHGWVFAITSGSFVDLEDLRLEGGTYCRLDNAGTVELSTVWVVGAGPNVTSTYGGVLNRASGTMTVTDSSLVASNASVSYGGGITNYGDLVIDNATVTGNTGEDGGGLLNLAGTASVLSSSFSGNSADNKGGAWANVEFNGSTGTVAYYGSSSYSSNSATVDCDKYFDDGGNPECVD